MYNLDINAAMTAAAASNGSATPRTPEIVNSLMAMTNPLDYYADGVAGGGVLKRASVPHHHLHHHHHHQKNHHHHHHLSSDSNSSNSSSQESPQLMQLVSASPAPPPATQPSLQRTCSQLIKAGLKLTIEHKRKLQRSDANDHFDPVRIKRIKRNESEEDTEEDKHHNGSELTAEDEERRRRRRERNKIAATKCRLKKRERTANLITESETLETQNVEFKKQLETLRQERDKLEEMLRVHKATCRIDTRVHGHQQRLPPVHSFETSISQHSFTNRPPAATSTHEDTFDSLLAHSFDVCNAPQYKTTPSIIVESVTCTQDDDPYPSLTDLDNPSDSSYAYINYVQNQNYGHGIDSCMA